MSKGGRKARYKARRAYFPVKCAFFDPWEEVKIDEVFRFSLPRMTEVEVGLVLTSEDPDKAARIVLMNCVHPGDKDRLQKHIERYPAFAQSCASLIMTEAFEKMRPVVNAMLHLCREELSKILKLPENEPFITKLYRRFFK